MALKKFITDLSHLSVEGCFNPWKDTCPELDVGPDAPLHRQARLSAHFENPRIEALLVGEAPGYQGCRYSGIAFTSERLLLEGAIPCVPRATSPITRRPRPFSEPSATILWGAFHDLGIHRSIALWNAFPLHPFKPGIPLSNRTPTEGELQVGGAFLRRLVHEVLPKNVQIIAVGEKAAASLRRLGFEVQPDHCLRHPANGGATAFRRGLANLFHSRQPHDGKLF